MVITVVSAARFLPPPAEVAELAEQKLAELRRIAFAAALEIAAAEAQECADPLAEATRLQHIAQYRERMENAHAAIRAVLSLVGEA